VGDKEMQVPEQLQQRAWGKDLGVMTIESFAQQIVSRRVLNQKLVGVQAAIAL
jgi:hypothetical protein